MTTFNRTHIAEYIADNGELTKGQAERAVQDATSAIYEFLRDGIDVRLPGLGTFRVVATPARTARNPRTGEAVHVPAGKRVKFTPAKGLKEAVK